MRPQTPFASSATVMVLPFPNFLGRRKREAAARQVTLGVSMRDYEKAVDGVCEGYGIRGSLGGC